MASKTKAQKLDHEVEQALEQALDIDFGDDFDIDMDLSAIDEEFSVDDLEEQISRAAEELVAEQNTKVVDAAKVSPIDITTEGTAKAETIATVSVIASPAAPPVPPVVNAAFPSAAPQAANVAPKPANKATPAVREAAPKPATSAPSPSQASISAVVAATPAAALTPANDDSRNGRAVAAAPRRVTERSSKLYWTTTAMSVLWAAGGVAISKAISPDVFQAFRQPKISSHPLLVSA